MSDTTTPEITPDLLPKEPVIENPVGQEQPKTAEAISSDVPNQTHNAQPEPVPEKPRVEIPLPKVEQPKSEFENIETVLSDDLKTEYDKMDNGRKAKFRTEGEKLAHEVMGLLHRPGTTAKDITPLIEDWLNIIPNVNVGWIASEARNRTEVLINKFKTD